LFFAAPECPPVDGPDAVYFPDPTDCSRFYECSNGVAYLFDCPAGLDFDPKLNVCNYPEQAGCRGGTTTVSPTPSTDQPESTTSGWRTTSTTSTTSAAPTTTTSTTSAAPTTTPGCDTHSPTETESSEPTRTTEGTTRSTDTTDDDNSSNDSNSSSDESNDSSKDSNSSSDESKNSSSNDSDTSNDSNGSSDDSDSSSDDSSRESNGSDEFYDETIFSVVDELYGQKCTVDSSNLSVRFHPTDCGKYLKCYLEKTLVKLCPANYHFHSKVTICMPPEYAKCGA
ncbi:CBM 14 domain containing protein, partial [Asbolus verrucosus]